MKPGIFISHSHSDNKITKQLVAQLKANGLNPWVDFDEMLIGDSLTGDIFEKIPEADFFLIILSKESVKSEWVKKELQVALNFQLKRSLKIIPVKVDNCDVPISLSDILYCDLDKIEFNNAFEFIMKSISYDFDYYHNMMMKRDKSKVLDLSFNEKIETLTYYQKLFSEINNGIKSYFLIRLDKTYLNLHSYHPLKKCSVENKEKFLLEFGKLKELRKQYYDILYINNIITIASEYYFADNFYWLENDYTTVDFLYLKKMKSLYDSVIYSVNIFFKLLKKVEKYVSPSNLGSIKEDILAIEIEATDILNNCERLITLIPEILKTMHNNVYKK